MNKKKVKNSPVYTYDYPVHDYADNSIYLVIYCNGKNIKTIRNTSATLSTSSLFRPFAITFCDSYLAEVSKRAA